MNAYARCFQNEMTYDLAPQKATGAGRSNSRSLAVRHLLTNRRECNGDVSPSDKARYTSGLKETPFLARSSFGRSRSPPHTARPSTIGFYETEFSNFRS